MCCTKTKTTKQHHVPVHKTVWEKKRRGAFHWKIMSALFFAKYGTFCFLLLKYSLFSLKQEIYQSLFNHTFFFFCIWPNLVHVLPSCWVSAERSHVDSGSTQDLQCVFCEGGNRKLNSQIRHYSEPWENTPPIILTSSRNEKMRMKMWFLCNNGWRVLWGQFCLCHYSSFWQIAHNRLLLECIDYKWFSLWVRENWLMSRF